MDLFDSMRMFVLAVDKGSLSAAAAVGGMSPTMAGNHLQSLEKRLGTKLLNRTTRRQSLTTFGERYYLQCQEILRLVAETDTQAQATQAAPRGLLRVTAPVSFGAEALIPALAVYLAQYPEVQLDLVLSDRTADLVEEGFEAAIRVGPLPDSGLIARPLAPYRMLICASPDYLARRGVPQSPAELAQHECLGFSYSTSLKWRLDGAGGTSVVPVAGRLKVNNGQALRVAALNGLGIVQQPAVLVEADIAAGRLVRLFADHELASRPMHIVYLPDRHGSPKLRSFIEFVVGRFGADQ